MEGGGAQVLVRSTEHLLVVLCWFMIYVRNADCGCCAHNSW